MPVYRYEEGEHNAGFVGLRVAVIVAGELKQKYYPFREHGKYVPEKQMDDIQQRAEKREKKWKEQQTVSSLNQKRACKEFKVNSMYTTGVRGIKMKFHVMKKHRAGELRSYYTPIFLVSGSNQGKRFSKNFNIMTLQFEQAWANAVFYYVCMKGLDNPDQLIKRIPPVEKFLIIFKELTRQGHKIPKNRLPTELSENKKALKILEGIDALEALFV